MQGAANDSDQNETMNVKVVSLFLVTSEVVEHFIRIFAKEAFLTSEPAVLDEDS